MIKYILASLLVFCISCNKDNYKKTEFFVHNTCDFSIEVKSSVTVRYSDGFREEHKTDIVQSNQILSMRQIDVAEKFTIRDVFKKMEIYNGTTKSTYDIMNRGNWVKTLSSEDKDEYTLTVDPNFF
jgi:hypothetical protein